MTPLVRNAGIMLLCATVMSGCAAPSAETLTQNNAAAAMVFPANYRALIARYILTRLPLQGISLKTAMISKPYDDRGSPIWRVHTPAVCVSVIHRNLLGMTDRVYFFFTFSNGQVERIYERLNGVIFEEGMCPDYTPFREVMSG